MASIPGHLGGSLPPELSVDSVEDCLHLSRSLTSLLGDTLVLRVAGEWLDEVRGLLARGEKMAAIQHYRMATGAGSKEAKDAVEAMQRG